MKKKMKVTFNAPVVLGIVGISFIATLLGYLTGGVTSRVIFTTYRSAILSPMTWIRAFLHIFGHADFAHFVGNMSYLLLIGPMLEEKYGSKPILQIIVITALFTGIVNYILFENVALCGASGVVFAFILLTSFTNFRQGDIPLTFILVTVVFLGQQVHDMCFIQDDISNLSHIIGGVVGAIIGYHLNRDDYY